MQSVFVTEIVSARDWRELHESKEFFYSSDSDVIGHNCEAYTIKRATTDTRPSVMMTRCRHFSAGFARILECLKCRARLSVIPRVQRYFPDGLIEVFSDSDEINHCYKQRRILAGSERKEILKNED